VTTITPSDFDYICDLVRREAAIVLEPGKEYLAENRLHPVARSQGLTSVEDLVRQLRGGSGELRGLVVDALTTNETSFFRDVHPWEALRTELIPQLIERASARRTLTIWCAASSSGQEPYTMAMLLREHFAQELDGWVVRILATDISPTMIERARTGMYSQLEVNRGLPAPMLVRHFERAGMQWQLVPEIRSMVEYRLMNLDDPAGYARLPMFDLIFIRNVLIYFDVATKREILTRARDVLRPDGYLFLGSSETTLNVVEGFERVQSGKTICYRAGAAR
jgi:chemotaxis protein methyltransferase CheR